MSCTRNSTQDPGQCISCLHRGLSICIVCIHLCTLHYTPCTFVCMVCTFVYMVCTFVCMACTLVYMVCTFVYMACTFVYIMVCVHLFTSWSVYIHFYHGPCTFVYIAVRVHLFTSQSVYICLHHSPCTFVYITVRVHSFTSLSVYINFLMVHFIPVVLQGEQSLPCSAGWCQSMSTDRQQADQSPRCTTGSVSNPKDSQQHSDANNETYSSISADTEEVRCLSSFPESKCGYTKTTSGAGRVSRRGMADLVKSSPDPHSPIWLPGMDYPVQYCVRQTRSMSQSSCHLSNGVEPLELPVSQKRKKRSAKSKVLQELHPTLIEGSSCGSQSCSVEHPLIRSQCEQLDCARAEYGPSRSPPEWECTSLSCDYIKVRAEYVL